MDTAYRLSAGPPLTKSGVPEPKISRTGEYILIALSLITLIGSLVATCMLSSQWGAYALIIAEVGIVLSIVGFALSRCCSLRVASKEVKATVPALFGRKMDGAHPLLKPLPINDFLRKSLPDEELLDIPLYFWLRPDPESMFGARRIEVMKDPTRKKQIDMINARLETLNTTLQFKERFENSLDNPMMLVSDLLPSWDRSRLKLSLLTDDELSQLKISSLAHFEHAIVWEVLGSRILQLSKEIPAPEEMDDLLVIHLPKLKAEQIHASPKDFPPVTFLLIERTELQKIATARLSTEQIELLYSMTFRDIDTLDEHSFVTLLKVGQVNGSIPLINNKKLFEHLSDDQILKLDYSKVDQPAFDVLFDLSSPRIDTLLDKISDRQLFSMRHLISLELREKMTPRQIKIIDGKLSF